MIIGAPGPGVICVFGSPLLTQRGSPSSLTLALALAFMYALSFGMFESEVNEYAPHTVPFLCIHPDANMVCLTAVPFCARATEAMR